MNSKIVRIIVIALIAVLALGFIKNSAAKFAVESAAEIVTGLKLRMGGMDLGIINTSVKIKNLKLYNPAGYKDRVMIDMPGAYVKYDLMSIFSGKVHIEDMAIYLKEFVVVKNEKGELNLNALKMVKSGKGEAAPAEKGKAPEIRIDKLQLKIDKVVYKDYSAGGEPSVKEFDINLNEQYSNIDNPTALASLIVVKALMNTSISSVSNFDIKGLQGTVSNTLGTAGKLTAEAVGSMGGVLQGTVQNPSSTAGNVAGGAANTVSGAADTVANGLKSLFGSAGKK